jgi:2-polyprenyl-6-methoxyphenol hydroxylase-like FAD-dependent oxidoreductase
MYDVAIVGAGPVGLFLACELGLAGCSVLVLERDQEPSSQWQAAPVGTRGLSAISLETFYRRDLLSPVLAASGVAELHAGEAPRARGGHFAGIMTDPAMVDLAALPYRLPTPAPDGILSSLQSVSSVLSERAAKYGVEIRRGVEVTAIEQDDKSVVLRAGDDEYAARWAVGCDGGRSTVRRLAGFDFVGTEPKFTGYLALATINQPEKLQVGFTLTPTGMYIRRPDNDRYFGVMDFDGGAFDRSQPPTLDRLQEVLRRVSGTDVTLSELELSSTFTDRAMQATTYRQGRVLLAGDAAHIHAPLGGQGLNLGLGDAMNLGWKLAATVRGDAPYGLLDSYTSERHPIGERVLDWSRAQVAIMDPSPHGQAIQAVVRDLIGTPDGATYVYQRITGLTSRYDLGSEHPLVARNAPDFQLEDGTRLGELLQDGRGVLLDFHRALPDSISRIRYAGGPARDQLGLTAVLVRPDGIVAWAADQAPDRDAFDQAVTRWF